MKNIYKNYNVESIDGQELIFCSSEGFYELEKTKVINDVPLSNFISKRLSSVEIPIIRKYPELQLAVLAKIIGGKPLFRYYPLLKINERFQRIDIRGINCQACKWSGFIGTPLASDIYFGISKELKAHELMRRARKHPKVVCPSCETDFNQFAIWVGELP